MKRKKTIGFGFDPEEAQQHFMVIVPKAGNKQSVSVYERFVWDEGDVQYTALPLTVSKAYMEQAAYDEHCAMPMVPVNDEEEKEKIRHKIILPYKKWRAVKPVLEKEFNRTLKAEGKLTGRFKSGHIPVERLLGKEMMVLLWAIEDCDSSVIDKAVQNWCGLSREERWWLFTMTNASTGEADDKLGWRSALRYALTENPVEERVYQGDFGKDWHSIGK